MVKGLWHSCRGSEVSSQSSRGSSHPPVIPAPEALMPLLASVGPALVCAGQTNHHLWSLEGASPLNLSLEGSSSHRLPLSFAGRVPGEGQCPVSGVPRDTLPVTSPAAFALSYLLAPRLSLKTSDLETLHPDSRGPVYLMPVCWALPDISAASNGWGQAWVPLLLCKPCVLPLTHGIRTRAQPSVYLPRPPSLD